MPITVDKLSFSYLPGTVCEEKALSDVSLSFERGEFTAIVGRTGCGKSSLLQLMAGLMRPSSGRVLLEGEDINGAGWDKRKLRKRLGIVFQYPEYQLFEATLIKDVSFALRQFNMSQGEINEAAEKALRLMGFRDKSVYGKSPLELSGGQKRRAAIAGILAAEPEYLLLDEPLAGLDAEGAGEFLKLLQKLRAEGAAVIMVTHSASAVAEYAGRVIVMDRGSVICDAPPRELYSSHALTEAAQGMPEAVEARELLRQRGVRLPEKLCREEELNRALIRLLKRRGR